MTALSDAYAGTVADQRGRGRLYLGVGLFVVGAILVVAGIVAAGSGLLTAQGYSLGEARWFAGILGGVGVPAVFLGIFTILPAGRTTRGTALIGASIAVFGVALFAYAYPCQWIGNTCATGGPNLTLPTAGVYFLGTLTTFWCLFTGVANFKTRNDPGGTVRMEIRNITGQTDATEERNKGGSLGGVGLFRADPDGDVATQTNTPGSTPAGGAAATSDGGATTEQLTSPAEEPTTTQQPTEPSTRTAESTRTTESTPTSATESPPTTDSTPSASSATTPDRSGAAADGVDQISPKASRGPTDGAPSRSDDSGEASIDRYCGSCAQFKYVRTDTGIQPYCAHHDELMDDMESCESWEPR